jgi:hypothetical protein
MVSDLTVENATLSPLCTDAQLVHKKIPLETEAHPGEGVPKHIINDRLNLHTAIKAELVIPFEHKLFKNEI